MAEIVYDYKHVPTIKKFSQSSKFIRGLMGPFGSGKSSGCVIELVKWGQKQPIGPNGKRRSRFAVIRNTYPQLKDTTIRTVQQWLPWPDFGTFVGTDHRYVMDKLDPELEIEILFRALDRPEHVANLLSLELTGAWVNEAREVPWAIIKALRGRVGRFPPVVDGGCIDPGIIADTNPPDDENWWYELFETRKPDNAELFRQPSGLSPEAENLPFLRPNYYQDLAAGSDDDFIKVYVIGDYGMVKDGKPVYPEYRDSVHCKDREYVDGVDVYRGWDFGLTPACVFSQVLPDGTWNTFDELTADSVGIHAFADTVLLHVSQNYPKANFVDIGDPAGMARSVTAKPTEEQTCFDILHGKGIMVEPGDQTLTTRIESVKYALNKMVVGNPVATVHSRCKKLRKGYSGRYQYKRLKIAGAAERFQDVPDKNDYSHPHDANQYVAARLFGGMVRSQIEQSKPIEFNAKWVV